MADVVNVVGPTCVKPLFIFLVLAWVACLPVTTVAIHDFVIRDTLILHVSQLVSTYILPLTHCFWWLIKRSKHRNKSECSFGTDCCLRLSYLLLHGPASEN